MTDTIAYCGTESNMVVKMFYESGLRYLAFTFVMSEASRINTYDVI